jgi:hypothetical protein
MGLLEHAGADRQQGRGLPFDSDDGVSATPLRISSGPRLMGRASSRFAQTFRHSLDGPDERLFGRVASKDGFKDIDQNRGKRR